MSTPPPPSDAPLTAAQIKTDLASMSRVSHRLAMIDNATQFESVVSKLLPKLLLRMGRNHVQLQQQQQQQQASSDLKPLLEQIQAKLMEILSHIRVRVTTSTAAVDPLPCSAILDLLVTDSSNSNQQQQQQQQLEPASVDSLTKNLSLTFLTVGVPKCANPAPLIPKLLVLLLDERQNILSPTQQSAATITLLLLQSLTALSNNNKVNQTTQQQQQDLPEIRSFLQQRDDCAAVLYEVLLDVLLWSSSSSSANATTLSSLPPAGLSQNGQERLQPAMASNELWGSQLSATKVALVELIAPSRKALFLESSKRKNDTTNHPDVNLQRTLSLLLVAKGQAVTSERAQTYWQMYFQTRDQKASSIVDNKSSKSPSEVLSTKNETKNGSFTEQETCSQTDLVVELVSLTMGQVQAEDTIGSLGTALPLHLVLTKKTDAENNNQDNTAIVWAEKRRAVSLSPTAATIWSSVAAQLLRPNHHEDSNLSVAKMVAFLAEKHLASSQGASSGMSILQAKPFLALAQLLQAVTLQLCQVDHQDATVQRQQETLELQTQFMKIASQLLKRQVTSAAVASSSSSSAMIMNSEGSWAVREECYSIICHLCRDSLSANKSIVTIETVSLLFACAAKEHERLRPRAVAALDALLEAFTRLFSNTSKDEDASKKSSPALKMDVDSNPWAESSDTATATEEPSDASNRAARESLAKYLVPLLWHAAQTHNPKASRVAAARWASELLKKSGLDLIKGCHLLCFLAGDPDVTAASIANQGLSDGMEQHFDEEGLPMFSTRNGVNESGRSEGDTFPDFAAFSEAIFEESIATSNTRVQCYWDFSFSGKAAALQYGLSCLMADIYGGDDDAMTLYLRAMTKTLEAFARESLSVQPGHDRKSVDLLDQCCGCLLATLRSSAFARREIVKIPQTNEVSYGMTIEKIQDLVIVAKSSKARRHLAGVVGTLFEDSSLWNGVDFSKWMSETGIGGLLARCAEQLGSIEKNHFQIGKLHGIIFLGGHLVRAIRLRLLLPQSSQTRVEVAESAWVDCKRVLVLLGSGVLHKEEVISNASVGAIGISLSFDSLDAPLLDPNLNDGVSSVLDHLSDGIKKYIEADDVDPFRAMGLIRVAGTVLGASSLSSVTSGNLHQSRQKCVEAVLSALGSMAFRKNEEIALVVGEALGVFSDSCNYESSGLTWTEDYQEAFALQLPPQEYVLYFLTTNNLLASSPHKRTATAAAVLGLVGRAARLVHLNESNKERAFIRVVASMLSKLQNAFIMLLSYPKIKHFSRESCCLGIAACHSLAEAIVTSFQDCTESLNHRLFRAFGQTSNHGGSAYQESSAQAQQRRATEQTSERQNPDRDILEPFGLESEVGGAAGMGEAALGAYREMAAASLAIDRPDILYALLVLSISHVAWFTGSTREKYNASTLLGDNSVVGNGTSTLEVREALRPHLGKLIPRILRACNDPNKQTRDQMGVLWVALAGGGAESRDAITQHFVSTVDILIQDSSNKLWRARAGATGALADIIVGRDWSAFGGGPPILSDDDINDDRTTENAGVRILRMWRVVIRAIDDVRDTVRTNGERLGRALRGLTVRLCDPSNTEKSNGEQLSTEGKVKWARDASAASATSLRWLVKHGLNQSVPETQGLCISTLVEIIKVAKPAIIEPSIPDVLHSLLLAMSSLEPAALNYVQLRTDNQDGLERARLQLAQSGPLATAVTKCVELLPNAKQSVQQQVVSELDSCLRRSVGFATRAAIGDTASLMCRTCPNAFLFSGVAGNANPSVRLMRAFYFAAERERGQGSKDKMIHALGNIAALCPGGSVRSLAVRACKRYKMSTGNNDDPASRRAAAAALRAITVRASNQLTDGGNSDIWSQMVLPVAFLGQKDSDKKAASLMKEVWDEAGAAVDTSATVRFGTAREEQLLPGLVTECTLALKDVSWERKVAGAKAFAELSDQGILAPLARSAGSSRLSKNDLERSKRRAKACFQAIDCCASVVLRPRLWTGKSTVVSALAKITSKWTAIQASVDEDYLLGWEGEAGSCPWTPISMEASAGDLFSGDNWFVAVHMEVDTNNESNDDQEQCKNPQPESMDSEVEDIDRVEEKDSINFSEMEEDTGDETPRDDEEKIDVSKQSKPILTFIGLCRLLLKEALPEKKQPNYELSDEYLPYRTSSLKAFHELVKSVPSSDIARKSLLYCTLEKQLLSCIRPKADTEEAPVIVAHAIDCLGQLFWDGFGSLDTMIDTIDPIEMCSVLRDASGKQQPAWTVRRAGALGLAAFVAVCDANVLKNSRIISVCKDSSNFAYRDKKFWRVREAGLRLVGALLRRVGPSSAQRDNRLLEAVLPHKEEIIKLLRGALTDSEPAVTALSSEQLPMLSWWP